MTTRDIRTVIPLPANITPTSLADYAQTWLLHLPADYYLPLPLRLLKPGPLQRLLLDSQAGIRLDHGAAMQLGPGEEWFYNYRLTFGLLSAAPVVKELCVPLTALYSDPPISLSELEAALRLLALAGSGACEPAGESRQLENQPTGALLGTTGVVRKDAAWGWRVLFRSENGEEQGSFPLASYARRQHGEIAVWEGLRRTPGGEWREE